MFTINWGHFSHFRIWPFSFFCFISTKCAWILFILSEVLYIIIINMFMLIELLYVVPKLFYCEFCYISLQSSLFQPENSLHRHKSFCCEQWPFLKWLTYKWPRFSCLLAYKCLLCYWSLITVASHNILPRFS